MEINKRLLGLCFVLLVVGLPVVSANPIGDFFTGIKGSVTNAFEAVDKFLIKLSIIGLNVLEVLLFVVFILLLVALFIVPARVYSYAKESTAPFKRFFDWVRR